MDVALAIEHIFPAAEYGGTTTENTRAEFDALRWEDSRPKPTWLEIQAAWIIVEPSLRPRQRKQFAALQSEVNALLPIEQSKLMLAVTVEFLAERPQFAKDTLGINIEGDEPKP